MKKETLAEQCNRVGTTVNDVVRYYEKDLSGNGLKYARRNLEHWNKIKPKVVGAMIENYARKFNC